MPKSYNNHFFFHLADTTISEIFTLKKLKIAVFDY